MGIELQVILTAYFVNSGWALVQLHNPIAVEAVSKNVDNGGRIQENTLNKMKEELWTAQHRNANEKGNLYERSNAYGDNRVVKREIEEQKTNGSLASASVDSSEERKRGKTIEELRVRADMMYQEAEEVRQQAQTKIQTAEYYSEMADRVQDQARKILNPKDPADDKSYNRVQEMFGKAEKTRREAEEEMRKAEDIRRKADAVYEFIRNNE